MTGLIYVGIIVVWAVVLVPAWLRRHDHRASERSVDRFSRSLEALSRRDSVLGIPLPAAEGSSSQDKPGPAATASEVLQVKRPAAPDAGRASGADSRAGAASAARRRRIVLGALGVSFLVVAGLVAGGVLLPVALAAPAVLIVTFLGVARHQVRAAASRRADAGRQMPVSRPVSAPAQGGVVAPPSSGETWEARPTTLPTYVTAPAAAEFPRVIDTTTPGAWTAAAMLERAQQQRARAERMAAAKAEAIARAKAEQAAAEARSRDEDFLAEQSSGWQAEGTSTPIYRPRAVNE